MDKEELRSHFGTDEDIKVLMKHNSLVKAKYNLTLVQNRVFELLLYKFQKEKDGILSCEIHRNELRNLIGKEKDKTIKGVSDLLESLRLKEILIAEKIKDKDKYKWHRFGLINGSTYDEDRDTFIVKATEEIYTLIQNYYDKREGHTPINLIVKLGMNNYYAQRLYDLLRVWSGTKQVINYEVSELKDLLQIDEKYNLYGDFKRRVILPAIKELNETGYFEIEIKENKVGRKVESIDFYVKDLDKRKYFNKDEIIKEIPNIVLEDVALTSSDDACDTTEESLLKEKPKKLDHFVPDETIFTKGTLRSFKKDFKDIDFKNEYMERAFDDAVMITLDRDDVETIKATSYKFFKGTLDNKIVEYKLEEKEDLDHKKEMDTFW
ncbi:replication initiation protein [Paraclostridium bifermentans]|uniref:replication initiation protein n=1 Tax=Paraclostridium bifermentans TaxID=1490 RepID=UPI001FF545D9|nr:replication initiation protein [Paraclostridium bifermentans]UOW69597.1 replication initiation protein [Paraclostridium bifermentans]